MKPPDFLCIGGHICGSSWFHRQLGKHPEIWTTPIKELHYWDRIIADGIDAGKHNHRMQALKALAQELPSLHTRQARRNIAWLWQFLMRGQKMRHNKKWYLSLFPESCIVGETTPAYEILDTNRIAEIAEMCPDTKILYILRNPVERAWSLAFKHLATSRDHDLGDNPVEAISNYITQDMTPTQTRLARAHYSHNIDRWRLYYGDDQMLILFFDEMREDPAAFFQKVESFLGVQQDVLPIRDASYVKTRKRHGSGQDYEMPDEVRRHLSGIYRDEIHELARRYDSYAEKWKEQLA